MVVRRVSIAELADESFEHLALDRLNLPRVTHSYSTYGLSLHSDICLPGLLEHSSLTDGKSILFSSGTQPEWVSEALQLESRIVRSLPEEPETGDPEFVLTEYGQEAFHQLAYTDGTRFVVDGSATKIWGQYTPPLTLEDLATYLLGPVLGFVLRRRSVTALHASTVSINGAAVVLCGAAGAGKSTTAAAFALRGTPVLCEDISALAETNERFWVLPGYPRVCLWPDAGEKLFGSAEALPRLTPTWEKCYLPLVGAKAQFEAKPRPLLAVYFLMPRVADASAPQMEEIVPREAVLELVQNTYMNAVLTRQQRAAEFDLLGRLAKRVAFRRVFPHSDAARLGALCDLIQADAASLAASGHAAAERPHR
jgi:hypothetical protein